jgi:hypothetical protein
MCKLFLYKINGYVWCKYFFVHINIRLWFKEILKYKFVVMCMFSNIPNYCLYVEWIFVTTYQIMIHN